MKRQLTPLAISLCLLGIVVLPGLTNAAASNVQEEKIDKLQREVSQLQNQMASFKKSNPADKTKLPGKGRYTPSVSPANDNEQIENNERDTKTYLFAEHTTLHTCINTEILETVYKSKHQLVYFVITDQSELSEILGRGS